MKRFRLALVAFASVAGFAHAQDEERRQPPIEIPDFSNLDEYIYEPKSTVRFGWRYIGGAKTSFAGSGRLLAPEDPGLATGANLTRVYHDGAVRPDARVVGRFDSSGNPIIDPSTNTQVFDPIAPDGRTNTWNYTDLGQLNPLGYVQFHSYSADILDATTQSNKKNSSAGMDLSVSRDMGKLFRGKLPWTLTAGISINDISANTLAPVRARVNTLTDYYSLFGQTPPTPPYSSPSSTSTTVLDASGNPLVNDDGTTQTVSVDTSVLIGNEPAGRTNTSAVNDTGVTNRWKLKGAYYTFRLGPTVWVPITSRLKASIGVGAAVVYSGSDYTVTQTLDAPLGADISETNSTNAYKLLAGYYADATVQFDLTERTGFYAGAVYQSAGHYTQTIDTPNAQYSTKIDLANQSGYRAGLSIRF